MSRIFCSIVEQGSQVQVSFFAKTFDTLGHFVMNFSITTAIQFTLPPPWTMFNVRSQTCVTNPLQLKDFSIVQGEGQGKVFVRLVFVSVNCWLLAVSM